MFQKDIPLSSHSNYKIGGPARFFVLAQKVEDVLKATEEARKQGIPVFILGGGTNLLISDTGFPGVVLKAGFSKIDFDKETLVTVGAGVSVKDLLQFCIDNDLSGLEWAGGLPGTVGGAVWGNAGAFKGEIKDSVVEVVSIDISSKASRTILRTNKECQFSYRNSIYKMNAAKGIQEVIIEIIFRLKKGDKAAIKAAIQEKIDYRIAKQPLDYPNIGSIFKNIDIKTVPPEVLKKYEHKIKMDPFPVLPTAVLIDAAGLKGIKAGGAMVSPKHPNFIINATGSAKAEDVKALMKIVKAELKKQFNIDLEQEVIFV